MPTRLSVGQENNMEESPLEHMDLDETSEAASAVPHPFFQRNEQLQNDDNEQDDEEPALDEQQQLIQTEMARKVIVNSSAVDMDQMVGQYKGFALTQRLQFIADHCPPLSRDAWIALIKYVQWNTYNVPMYQLAHSRLSHKTGSSADSGTDTAAPSSHPDILADQQQTRFSASFDQAWVDQTTKRAQLKLEKLDTDLKHYKNNSIKESIRRGQDDLGEHYLEMGNLPDALKCFNRARDYCTSSKHVLQMCFNVIKVSAYLNNWSLVSAYVTRAEHSGDLKANGGSKSDVTQRAQTLAKLRGAAGLADLCTAKYRQAAKNFLQVSFDNLDYKELLSGRDVAVYGTLCALATYDRAELQRNVIQNTGFKQFLELEPQLSELIVKFNDSAYGICLNIMAIMRDSFLLDKYLSDHVDTLYKQIRDRGLVQYFSPYLSADMKLMAQAFNTSVMALEDELIHLILKGEIKARIDSQNKILHARDVDERAAAYEQSLAVGRALAQRAKAVAVRAAAQRAAICVRIPSNRPGSQQIVHPSAAGIQHQLQQFMPALLGGGSPLQPPIHNNNSTLDDDLADTPQHSGQSSPR